VGAGAELKSLGDHVAHEVLGQDLGEPGDVEDVLLRVERHELPAQRRQGVDDAAGRPPHAGVEGGEQPGGASADDRDIPQLLLCHIGSCVDGPGFRDKRWNV
jgi:hypothetical protein